jgi:hypothetical protein
MFRQQLFRQHWSGGQRMGRGGEIVEGVSSRHSDYLRIIRDKKK